MISHWGWCHLPVQGSCESPRLNTTALAAALGSAAWPASPAEAPVTLADTAPLTPAPVAVEACLGWGT